MFVIKSHFLGAVWALKCLGPVGPCCTVIQTEMDHLYIFVCRFVFCLFDLILYTPVNDLSVMSGGVFLG